MEPLIEEEMEEEDEMTSFNNTDNNEMKIDNSNNNKIGHTIYNNSFMNNQNNTYPSQPNMNMSMENSNQLNGISFNQNQQQLQHSNNNNLADKFNDNGNKFYNNKTNENNNTMNIIHGFPLPSTNKINFNQANTTPNPFGLRLNTKNLNGEATSNHLKMKLNSNKMLNAISETEESTEVMNSTPASSPLVTSTNFFASAHHQQQNLDDVMVISEPSNITTTSATESIMETTKSNPMIMDTTISSGMNRSSSPLILSNYPSCPSPLATTTPALPSQENINSTKINPTSTSSSTNLTSSFPNHSIQATTTTTSTTIPSLNFSTARSNIMKKMDAMEITEEGKLY